MFIMTELKVDQVMFPVGKNSRFDYGLQTEQPSLMTGNTQPVASKLKIVHQKLANCLTVKPPDKTDFEYKI
jgi:hypothetical protein